MSRRYRVYRSRSPVRTVITIAAAVLIIIVIFCSLVFFGFRKYIVYTNDGLRLEVPWLQETVTEEELHDTAEDY